MDDPTRTSVRTARVLATGMSIGVVLFWGVTLALTRGGRYGLAPDAMSATLGVEIWGLITFVGFGGALALRRKAVVVAARARREGSGADASVRPLGLLLVSWALLEVPALLGGVLFVLLAVKEVLWVAAAVYALGMMLTFPRAGWLEERAGPAAGR